jgi:hypothetical protein
MSYRTISYEEAVVGMTVVLTTDRHGASQSNPVMGWGYQCNGVIDDLVDGSIYVSWANGHSNVYESGDLSVENGSEGIYVDMWRNLY